MGNNIKSTAHEIEYFPGDLVWYADPPRIVYDVNNPNYTEASCEEPWMDYSNSGGHVGIVLKKNDREFPPNMYGPIFTVYFFSNRSEGRKTIGLFGDPPHSIKVGGKALKLISRGN